MANMWNALKSMRESSAYTRAEVAKAIGKSEHTVWSIECGKTKMPRPPTVRKLAEFYGVTPDEIRAACAQEAAA